MLLSWEERRGFCRQLLLSPASWPPRQLLGLLSALPHDLWPVSQSSLVTRLPVLLQAPLPLRPSSPKPSRLPQAGSGPRYLTREGGTHLSAHLMGCTTMERLPWVGLVCFQKQ